ncbi:hypothetical protein [uncultured Marinobacter sp.]|uniref:hypothetical protein n=1 Tax=uncultured Marinobacter sp. TaxID=187379 RepID=UPI0030DC8234|tara:strand:- start:1506 stop:1856 length:351 start_codon:yes stop_codon:yes gene_type:complete
MLTLSAPVFDIDGTLLIERPEPDGLTAFSRRVSRSPTLDGGAAVTDFGYSPADRTLRIEWTPRTLDEAENARRLVKSYGRLIVSFSEGCFFGAPESFDLTDGTVTINILVERQLSA